MTSTRVLPRLMNFVCNFSPTVFNLYFRHSISFNRVCSCHQPISSTFSIILNRRYSQNSDSTSVDNAEDASKPKSRISNHGKYKIFQDYDSPVILDVDEERQLYLENPEAFNQEVVKIDEFAGMNLERGENGVFEIEELVELLKNENARNVVVIKIPKEMHYSDHMVIVTGNSYKHLKAISEYIRRLFKRKKHPTDIIPRIEGAAPWQRGSNSEWLALDLGNIVLHLFLHRMRMQYDLETLWAVGREFDDLSNMKEDQYIALLKEHSYSPTLDDLQPLETNVSDDKLG